MPVSPDLAHHRARVAATARAARGSAAHDDAKRDLEALKLQKHIQKVVSTWPPLSDEQRTRLAELLAPARQAIRDHRLATAETQQATK